MLVTASRIAAPIAIARTAAEIDRMARLAVTALLVTIAACSDNPGGPRDDRPAVVIAHRGASYVAPEHTVAAYDRAIADGADYIEQDIARTKDGVLVVIHDATLDRTARGPASDCKGAVADKTLQQLRRCDFGVWFNESFADRAKPGYAGLGILTLEEVIGRYRDDAMFYIEIKNPELYPGIETEVARVIGAAGLSFDDVVRPDVFVQSFSAESLRLLHSIDPGIPLVQLLGSGPIGDPVTTIMDIQKYADGIGLPGDSMPEWVVAMAHTWCLAVHPYAVENPEMIKSLLGRRVDGIFTDRPDVLRDAIDSMEPLTPPLQPRCGIAESRAPRLQ